jgi:hypothetical protein
MHTWSTKGGSIITQVWGSKPALAPRRQFGFNLQTLLNAMHMVLRTILGRFGPSSSLCHSALFLIGALVPRPCTRPATGTPTRAAVQWRKCGLKSGGGRIHGERLKFLKTTKIWGDNLYKRPPLQILGDSSPVPPWFTPMRRFLMCRR